MTLRLSLLSIGAASGLLSAINWLADEVDHFRIHAALVSPVVIILYVLLLFFQRVLKERE